MATSGVICPVVVGRDDELSALEDALLRAVRGAGGVVLLGGDAGMGKSRLARELATRAARLGSAVMVGSCSEAELALPYLPFLEVVGNHLSQVGDVAALKARLGPVADELARLFPQLGPPSGPGGDPMQAKLGLFEGFLAVIRDAAGERGLLLVLEDLHWADPATRELLDYLTRRLRLTNVLVLATYRTDELHRKHPLVPTVQGWKRSGQAEVVELESLSLESVAAMVAAIFDEREVSDEFRDFMHERAEGNPFVIEEMLRDARDRGDIFQTQAGDWDRKGIAELRLRIPRSVRDTILLRLERLGKDEVEVLAAASVLGRSSELGILTAVTGKDPDTVLAALQVCVMQQLLEEDPLAPSAFRFRHALTREAVYEDMVAPRRQLLHRKVADALRTWPGSRAVDVANHLLAAGSHADAVAMVITAADEAMSARAYRDAANLYERAAPHVDDTLQRGRFLAQAGNAYWSNGESMNGRRMLEEAVSLLESSGQTAEAAAWRVLLGRCHWELQHSDLAMQEFKRAVAVLEPLGPSEALATAYMRVAGIQGFDRQVELARDNALLAIETARAAKAEMVEAWSFNFLALAEVGLGEVSQGFDHLDASYLASVAGNHGFQADNAIYNATWIALHLGSGQRVRDWVARMVERSGQLAPFWAAYLRALVGLYEGRVAQSIEQARDGLRLAEEGGHEKFAWRSRVVLAQALAEADRGPEAQRELPPAQTRVDLQDAVYDGHARIRGKLALGDLEAARAEARGIPPSCADRGSPADAVAEVMRGDSAWLADFMSRIPATGEVLATPRRQLAQAWFDLAERRLQEARTGFEAAERELRAGGLMLDAWYASRGLALAQAAAGDPEAAAARFESVIGEATAAGARLVARLAYEDATELGLQVRIPEPGPEAAVLTGERLVSVLFADVRGYTERSGAWAPAANAERIASLQRWAGTEVHRHRGIVDKFAGDAVMATFNVSGASLDHTVQALQAAVAIQDKASLMDLPIGAGIAVGPAVVGQLAPGANVSVLGEATNLAARLQAAAGPGEVLLSFEAHRRVADWLRLKNLPAEPVQLTVKGFDEPVKAFRVRPRALAPAASVDAS